MSSEATEILEGTELPVADTLPVEAPPAPIEFRYEYQPTDEQGRPLGGKQVVKYTTSGELADKLAEQSTLLLRKLRSETRKNRLGISDDETIPEEAPRYREPVSFKPKVLSADERGKIARDLLDPERFEEASDALFEAKMGASPQVISQTLTELHEDRMKAQAKAASDGFLADNPQYVRCKENFEAITNWIIRYDLAPVKENFQKAYDTLRAAGILVENVEDVPEPPTEAQPQIAPVIAPVVEEAVPLVENVVETIEPIVAAVEPPKSQVPRIPTGLNRNNSDDTGGAPRSVGDDIVFEVLVGKEKRRYTGLAAVNAMPSDEFKRRVNTERGFAQKVEKLESEAVERKRSARR